MMGGDGNPKVVGWLMLVVMSASGCVPFAFFGWWAGGCRVVVVVVMSAGKRVGWAACGAAVSFPSTRLGEAFCGTSHGTLDWKRRWYSREDVIFIVSLFLVVSYSSLLTGHTTDSIRRLLAIRGQPLIPH